MSKQNVAYWAKRAALLQFDRMEAAEQISSEIAEIYYHAAKTIEHDMKAIFREFAGKFELSEPQAMKILNFMGDDISKLEQAFLKAGISIPDTTKAFMNRPDFQRKLARLQALLDEVDEIGRKVYGQDFRYQKRWYTGLCQDTYYHTIYDVQRESGFGFSFAHIDDDLIQKIMNSKWGAGNLTYSQRLWHNVEGTTREVRKQLTLGILTGKTEKRMAEEIANKYGTGAFESRRLVRTEACYLSGEIQAEAYEECGASKYLYIATLDIRTDEECGVLDRKIFSIKKRKVGRNYPPMHPFCRCSTKIYIDQQTRDDMKRRARDPKTGKNRLVPANLSYVEWAKQNDIPIKSKQNKSK